MGNLQQCSFHLAPSIFCVITVMQNTSSVLQAKQYSVKNFLYIVIDILEKLGNKTINKYFLIWSYLKFIVPLIPFV